MTTGELKAIAISIVQALMAQLQENRLHITDEKMEELRRIRDFPSAG